MKARCTHGVAWFRDDCLGCVSERIDDWHLPARQLVFQIPFWREMSAGDAIAFIQEAAESIRREESTVKRVRELLDRAIEAL